MKELSFDRTLYAGESVDEATKVFADYATFELEETDGAWVVKLSGEEGDDYETLRELVGEFQNYVLGLTVQRQGN